MYGFKDYYFGLSRPGTALIILMLLIFVVLFVISCSDVQRHNVLTFFFDGVPPIGQDQLPEELVDSNSSRLSQTRPKQIWFVHEPRKDCSNCHNFGRRRFFSPQTYLIKPIPELCYGCHDDYTTSTPYVHGPVAVGQCLLCHHHHQSRIEHLLKEPEPQLCYQCHNIDMINLIPAHLTEEQFACTDCHNAHTSSIKYLLKEASLLTENGIEGIESTGQAVQNKISVALEKQEGGLYDLTKMTNTTESEKNSMFQLFWTVSKLIEKGQIKEARAYLENFKQKSNVFTNEKWREITQVLNQIDVIAARKEGDEEKAKHQKVVAGGESERPITGRRMSNSQLSINRREIARLYYLSLAFYYAGRMEKAREALLEVLSKDSIPPIVAKSIQDDLIDIDNRLRISVRKREIANLYYSSMVLYHSGQFEKSRQGLVKVLKSGLVPEPMIMSIEDCLTDINSSLGRAPRVKE